MQLFKYNPLNIFGELATQKRLCSFGQTRSLGLTHYESKPYALLCVDIKYVIIAVLNKTHLTRSKH